VVGVAVRVGLGTTGVGVVGVGLGTVDSVEAETSGCGAESFCEHPASPTASTIAQTTALIRALLAAGTLRPDTFRLDD